MTRVGLVEFAFVAVLVLDGAGVVGNEGFHVFGDRVDLQGKPLGLDFQFARIERLYDRCF